MHKPAFWQKRGLVHFLCRPTSERVGKPLPATGPRFVRFFYAVLPRSVRESLCPQRAASRAGQRSSSFGMRWNQALPAAGRNSCGVFVPSYLGAYGKASARNGAAFRAGQRSSSFGMRWNQALPAPGRNSCGVFVPSYPGVCGGVSARKRPQFVRGRGLLFQYAGELSLPAPDRGGGIEKIPLLHSA